MTLDPTEALALQCLRYWWSVVKRGKGGEIDDQGRTWTRVSGTEAARWIDENYHADLNPRRILRAFDRLVEKGFAVRERRWKERYNQAYSYAPVTNEPSTVTSDTAQPLSVDTHDQSNKPEWAQAAVTSDRPKSTELTDLSTKSTTTSTKESAVREEVINDGERSEAPEEPQASPVVEWKGSIKQPASKSLKAILERCEGIGRGEQQNPWEVGKERREARQLEQGRRLPEHAVTRHNPRDKSD